MNTEKVEHWNSRGHFFGAAAEAMRRILVENARRKGRLKRGGDMRRHDAAIIDPAVQHAHQKGVIHRDLKPSNVLVAHDDTVPLPKIIDFGIAKATSQPLTERTLFTALAQVVGTPLYMSPEQAALNHLDVDTRSDVYSLGVLLYELLTGTTPFEQERLRQAGLDEVRRIIREEEPPRPSTRVSTMGAVLSTVSQHRSVDPRRISVALRGDLDWIVMKALEKDRQRRYESPSALAADVGRYLKNEAVEACPPSAAYRLRKFAGRHRRVLATAAVVAFALVAATAVSTWQAVRARDAQRQAETDRDKAKTAQRQSEVAEARASTEAAVANEISSFLQRDLLRQVDVVMEREATPALQRNLTVKEALDRAAGTIGDRFQDQPLVEAAIRSAIGQAYRSLGENQIALPNLERAAALRKLHYGPEHLETLDSQHMLAISYQWNWQLSSANALLERVLEKRKAVLGDDHAATLSTLVSLAEVCRFDGLWNRAISMLEDLLETRTRMLGIDAPETVSVQQKLGVAYTDRGRFPEAIALLEQALRKKTTDETADKSDTTSLLQQLGEVYQYSGK